MSVREMVTLTLLLWIFFPFLICLVQADKGRTSEINLKLYREKVKKMFYHAYNGYLNHAYPYDELQPLTCTGHDTWGSYSLTLIDALDTLVVMGNYSEFRRIAQILIEKGDSFFDIDINVSVFETNIRIVGGLLSAHLMMKRAGMVLEPSWPCSGPLLQMADNIARKILPAFDTPTGMPYGTVNLRHGVPKGETTVTCTAGVGTFIVEFGTLSRLTGDPIFEKTAIRAMRALWKYRSPIGLLGNHVDVANGKWTAQDSGIGGGIDSYFEYLVKGSIMFNIPELLHMFREYEVAIKKFLKRDDWYMWAQMTKGTITLPLFTSLDGYWPSIKGMLGDLDEAMKTMHNFHQVWRQFGFTPEYYNILKADVHQGREGYPLRPEIVESAMYLYQATKDPYLLEIGVDIVEAIEHSARTSCGYATVKDVRDHRLEDRMESFFLAETTKYLYLLFDPDNFVHNNGSHGELIQTPSGTCVIEAGGYVFNTEAHPIDLAAVHCCSAAKKEEDRTLQEFHDNLDLLSLLHLVDENDWMLAERKQQKKKKSGMKKVKQTTEQQLNTKRKEVMGSEDDHDDDDNDFEDEEEEEEENPDNHFETVIDHSGLKASADKVHYSQEREKRKQLQVVDLISFTEAERNFTHLFMEQLQMDAIRKNISSQIAAQMKQQYMATEFENLASNVARKLIQAGEDNTQENVTLTASDSQIEDMNEKSEKNDGKADSKSPLNPQGESTVTKGKSTIETGVKSQDSKVVAEETEVKEREGQAEMKTITISEPVIHIKITTNDAVQQIVQQNTDGQSEKQTLVVQIDKSSNFESTTESSSSSSSSSSPSSSLVSASGKDLKVNFHQEGTVAKESHLALQKFKSHIELQIQNQDNQQQHQSTDDSTSSQLSSSVTTPPLENKRSNIVSITTKILKIFSGTSTDVITEDEEVETRVPSIAGLYEVLANYTLKYLHDPQIMHCPAQSFHSRISVYGEMFPDEF